MSILKKSSAALAVAAVLSAGAQAATFEVASSAVASKLTTKSGGYNVVGPTASAVKIKAGANYNTGDRLVLTLNQGEFANASYAFHTNVTSGAGSVNVPIEQLTTTGGKQSLNFRFTENFTTSGNYLVLVSGAVSTAVNAVFGEAIEINVADAAVGSKVEMSYTVSDLGGTVDTATSGDDFAVFLDQYSGSVEDKGDAIIDVAQDRLLFTGKGSTAQGAIAFASKLTTNADTTRFHNWSSDDDVVITLSGDMTGVEKITGTLSATSKSADFTIGTDSATLTIDGASLGTAQQINNTSVAIKFVVDEATQLQQVVYKADAEFDFKSYDDEVVVANKTLASWSVNGLNVVINHFSLNSSFINWMKIANAGSLDADIEATFTYTNADGSDTSESVLMTKKATANAVTTISEADLLEAMGMTSADPLTDVSVHLFIAAKAQDVQVHAEKKAGDTGRISIPVRYDTTNTARKYR